MPRFAANLSMMFTEWSFLDRFAAAADAYDRAVKLHFSYQRFLENQIRDAFGFIGSPIWIKNRARD